jgi:hypothetical protein
MNKANVEAIVAALDATEPGGLCRCSYQRVAEMLASQGVLVPSTLTHEDEHRIMDEAISGDFVTLHGIPETLERIAKGEV